MTELLPCPFCDYCETYIGFETSAIGRNVGFRVCVGCHGQGGHVEQNAFEPKVEFYARIDAAWNRRVPDPLAQRMATALQAITAAVVASETHYFSREHFDLMSDIAAAGLLPKENTDV